VKRFRYPLAALLLVATTLSRAESPAVVYRVPQSFTELPTSIAASLAEEGCRIPQGTIEGKVVATNVISGHFAKKGQTDWAILCSRRGRQYIRVFWGGTARCPSRIDKGPEMSEEGIRQGLEFDRAIDTVDRAFILHHYEAYGGLKPPKITHLGISYEFLEKASVVHYCHKGKWLELTGAD
jgi:hypothetical protein